MEKKEGQYEMSLGRVILFALVSACLYQALALNVEIKDSLLTLTLTFAGYVIGTKFTHVVKAFADKKNG